MAPKLSKYQRDLSRELLLSGIYSNKDIARVVRCSTRAIREHCRKLRVFGSISGVSTIAAGRDPILSKTIIAALICYLCEKPDVYLDEMAWFIWDEFQIVVSTSTISRTLRRVGWSKKQV